MPTTGTNLPGPPHPHPCPSCGHCPTCGRNGRRYPAPYWPYPYPYTTPYVQPGHGVGPPNRWGTITVSSAASSQSGVAGGHQIINTPN